MEGLLVYLFIFSLDLLATRCLLALSSVSGAAPCRLVPSQLGIYTPWGGHLENRPCVLCCPDSWREKPELRLLPVIVSVCVLPIHVFTWFHRLTSVQTFSISAYDLLMEGCLTSSISRMTSAVAYIKNTIFHHDLSE